MIEHATPIEYELNPYEMELARQNPHPELGVAGAISEARRLKGQVPFPIYRGAKRHTPAWTGLHRTYVMRIAPGGITYREYRKPDDTKELRPYSFEVLLGQSGQTTTLYADSSADAPPTRARINADGTVSYQSMIDEPFGMVKQISPHAVLVEVHAPWYRLLMLPDRDQVQRPIMVQEDCPRCNGKGVIQDVAGPPSTYDPKTKTLQVPKTMRLCPVCDSGQPFQPRQLARSSKDQGYRGKRAAIPPALKRSALIHGEIKESCPRCDPKWGPCYFHQKAPAERPRYEYTIGKDGQGMYAPASWEATFEFTNPSAVNPSYEPPERALRYDRSMGVVVDGNGNPPHPNLLLMRWPGLLRNLHSDAHRENIMAQVSRVLNTLPTSRPKRVNYSWNKESSRDPWHGYCALNAYDKDHGGHPEGEADLITGDKSEIYGASQQVARGVQTRGLDFQLIWNDQFGTPRSDQSTNPQRTYVDPTQSLLEDKTKPENRKRRLEIADPNFCQPKYQERMEWERVTNTGMRIQEELLLNEGLEAVGKQDPTLTINGEVVHVPHEPKDVPSSAAIQDLGIALPIEAHVHFEADDTATTDDPDWPGEKRYWAGPPTQGQPQRLPAKKLLAWLDETSKLEGSEKTRTSGYYITNRQRLLGYSMMHNQKVSDMDIISIAEGELEPHSDPTTAEQENDEYLVCPKCYREFDTDTGAFEPEEIIDAELRCPSGDGGLLVRRIRRPEWLDAAFQLDSDQVREFIDPTYRREVDGTLAAPADTASWNNRLRLEQMYCEHWTPRVQVPRNQV
jgi:hypothetical protein